MGTTGDSTLGPLNILRLKNIEEYWDYFTMKKISSGMEWVVENLKLIYELRPALHKEGGNYFKTLKKIVEESPGMHQHSVVYYPDLLARLGIPIFSDLSDPPIGSGISILATIWKNNANICGCTFFEFGIPILISKIE